MFSTFTDRIISSVIALGSLFFPFIDGIEPGFTNISLERDRGALVLSLALDNCYTEELDKILMSGQSVTLHFQADLRTVTQSKTVLSKKFFHRIRYNPLEKHFQLYRSETGETTDYTTLQQVHNHFSSIRRVKILSPEDLEKNRRYYLNLSAYLEPVTFIGQSSDLDLMLFWNNKKPTINTNEFDLSIFYF